MDYKKAFHSIDMDPMSYAKRFALPVIIFGFVMSFLMQTFLSSFLVGTAAMIPVLLPIVCIGFAFYYPFSIAASKASRINNSMHYYITQMGAVATAETPRIDIIRIVSENRDYADLADETKKVFELVTVWNLSLSEACRFISKRTPSVIFEDFLDRFAHALQSGEEVKSFLSTEQGVVMNEYDSMYEGSMYMVEVFKELFVSLVMSLIFLASFAVIVPVVTGMNAILLMSVVVLVFVGVDIMMVALTKSKVPKDPIWSKTSIITDSKLKMYRSVPVSILACILVTTLVVLYGKLPTPIAVAMSLTPLAYTGFVTRKIEKGIKRRDENFPSFIRSLGSSAGARGGMVDEALKALRVHDFGPLTSDVNSLYKRLNTRVDKKKSWELFAASTGSHLIQRYSVMFVESTHLGGKPEIIGDIIANNFHRIVNLRKKRFQSASSLVGVLYGLTAGIGFTLYISLGVVEIMQEMFGNINMPPGMGMAMILHTDIGSIEILYLLVILIMVLHSLISAILLRVVDGGHIFCSSVDFVIMVWISGASAVVTKSGVASLLGGS